MPRHVSSIFLLTPDKTNTKWKIQWSVQLVNQVAGWLLLYHWNYELLIAMLAMLDWMWVGWFKTWKRKLLLHNFNLDNNCTEHLLQQPLWMKNWFLSKTYFSCERKQQHLGRAKVKTVVIQHEYRTKEIQGVVHCCYYISLLPGWWNIVQGGDPLYAAGNNKWDCGGHIWPNWVQFFAKNTWLMYLVREQNYFGSKK